MRRIKRLLRSPWFWAIFILAQFVHPREPLAYTLWMSFGTQRDLVVPQSLQGKRLENGDLEVRVEVLRRVEWFGVREERVDRRILVPAGDLERIQNRYRMAKPMENPWLFRDEETAEGELPVLLSGLYPGTEFEALSMGPLGTGWTSGWKDEGDWLIGYRLKLPVKQDGDRPGALAARVLLTPLALLADLLALPVILGSLLIMVLTMAATGGH